MHIHGRAAGRFLPPNNYGGRAGSTKASPHGSKAERTEGHSPVGHRHCPGGGRDWRATATTRHYQGRVGHYTPTVPAVNTPQIKQSHQGQFPLLTVGWDLPADGKGDEEITDVLEEVVHKGMDSNQPNRLAGGAERWWKDTSTAFKNFHETKAYNPTDLSFNTPGSTAQAMVGQVSTAAGTVGSSWLREVAENLATEALTYGWEEKKKNKQRHPAQHPLTGGGHGHGPGGAFNPNFLSTEQAEPTPVPDQWQGRHGSPLATSTYNNIAQAARRPRA